MVVPNGWKRVKLSDAVKVTPVECMVRTILLIRIPTFLELAF